jgi:hypothetical protein
LAKDLAEQLVPAGEGFDPIVSAVAADATLELLQVNEIPKLGTRVFFGKHIQSLQEKCWEKSAEIRDLVQVEHPPDPIWKPVNIGSF